MHALHALQGLESPICKKMQIGACNLSLAGLGGSQRKRDGALNMTVTGTDGLTIIVLALVGLMAARLFIEGMRK